MGFLSKKLILTQNTLQTLLGHLEINLSTKKTKKKWSKSQNQTKQNLSSST
jgi:hypothetical protein